VPWRFLSEAVVSESTTPRSCLDRGFAIQAQKLHLYSARTIFSDTAHSRVASAASSASGLGFDTFESAR